VKNQFLAKGTAEDQNRHEKQRAPVGAMVLRWSEMGQTGGQGKKHNKSRCAETAGESHKRVVKGLALEGKSDFEEVACIENQHAESGRGAGGNEPSDRNAEQVATGPIEERDGKINRYDVKQKEYGRSNCGTQKRTRQSTKIADMRAKWLGHSTVLLRIGETTVLTDPVFSTRVGIGLGPLTIGVKRIRPAALAIGDFPVPDLILLSHAHFDHFDRPSLRRLESMRTTVVTAKRTSDLLRVGNYQAVHELGWGDSVRVGALKVQAFPVRHWGARMQTDRYRGYNGYTIQADRERVIFGGDTARTDTFRALRGPVNWDLAIMPIGAYDPWINAHCTPEEALLMADEAGAEHILPVHHQTFVLSREPLLEPIERFQTVVGLHQHRIALTEIGDEFRV